jgi:hypothetical protein
MTTDERQKDEMKTDEMTTKLETRPLCPVHGHALVNVHKVRDGQRIVIGKLCPEPHCTHSEMEPRSLSMRPLPKRAAM